MDRSQYSMGDVKVGQIWSFSADRDFFIVAEKGTETVIIIWLDSFDQGTLSASHFEVLQRLELVADVNE